MHTHGGMHVLRDRNATTREDRSCEAAIREINYQFRQLSDKCSGRYYVIRMPHKVICVSNAAVFTITNDRYERTDEKLPSSTGAR